MTLIEVMVSTGLVGIIMAAVMVLLGRVGGFASVFHSQASTIEAVASAVASLNSSLPLVTRVTACNCYGAGDSRDTCRWTPGTNAWWDPSIHGGQAGTVVLLAGEYEAHDGPSTQLTDVLGSSIGASYQGQTCATPFSDLGTANRRGCKQTFSLNYIAPTKATVSTPSNAGMLTLTTTAASGTPKVIRIGQNDADGLGGVGVTQLSCGFDKSASTVSGLSSSLFVLNFRIKGRSNTIRDPTNFLYESWYPIVDGSNAYAAKNFSKGQLREVRLKFAMRNISVRGMYSWRPESIRNCKTNGQTAANAEQCCSQALSGGTCTACVPGGSSAGSAAICCSKSFSSGTTCR